MSFEKKLLGKNYHNLDAKGRIIVPAKYRDKLGSIFVAAKSLDKKCITVYPLPEWNKMEEKLLEMSNFNKNAMRVRRYLFTNAYDCETDPQGRFLIPSDLREYAGITKEAVTSGMGSFIEIWSKEEWQLNGPDVDGIDDDVLNELSELG